MVTGEEEKHHTATCQTQVLALHEEQLDPSLHSMKMKNVCLLHPRSESPRLARAEPF